MPNNSLAPIVLFVYNRPWHTQQTLESLANNKLAKDSILYIYADGAKDGAEKETIDNIEKTREIIRSKKWCKELYIIEAETNKGLADSIIEGVTSVINKHETVIVLEDDIVVSTGFLQYMNEALEIYKNEEKVMHISGFVPQTKSAKKLPETYFLRFMSCWGWATWKSAWDKIILDTEYIYKTVPTRADYAAYNMEGAINMFAQIESNYRGHSKTWAIKWYSSIFIQNALCLYPKQSLVRNIGHDGTGVHGSTKEAEKYKVKLAENIETARIEIKECKLAKEYLKRFYISINKPPLKERIYRSLRNTFLYPIYKKIRK